jgi:hypothetical protein
VKAYFHDNEEAMMNMLKEHIRNNEGFISCYDSNDDMKVKSRILRSYASEDSLDKFKLYSSEEGSVFDLGENIVEAWKDKYVFYTPRILYGLDFSIESPTNVYGFYQDVSITAFDIMQQLNRCRNVKDMNIYVRKVNHHKKSLEFDDIKKEISDNLVNHKALLSVCVPMGFNKLYSDEEFKNMKLFGNLYTWYEYYDRLLSGDTELYLKELLEKKGYEIVVKKYDQSEGSEENDQILREVKDAKLKMISDSIQHLSEYKKIQDDGILSEKLLHRLKGLGLNPEKIKDDEVPLIVKLLSKPNYYNGYKALKLYFTNSYDYVEEVKKDFEIKLLNSVTEEIRVLKEIEKELGYNHLEFDSEKITKDHSDYCANHKGKVCGLLVDMSSRYKMIQSLNKIYHHIYSPEITNNERPRKDGTRQRKYSINKDWIEKCKNLWIAHSS